MSLLIPSYFNWRTIRLPYTHFTRLLWRAVFLLGILCLSCTSSGNTYYVDALDGDDTNSGTSAVPGSNNEGPWKSLSKVNETTFAPGDSILFKRGGLWTGTLEPENGGAPGGTITISETILSEPLLFDLIDPNDNQCVYFGAYGEGEKPTFDCLEKEGIIIGHNYVIVEDFRLINGGNNTLLLSRDGGNYWAMASNIDIIDPDGHAVRLNRGGGNCWLRGLRIYDWGTHGIFLMGSSENQLRDVLVEDCYLENAANTSIEDGITCHRDGDGNDIFGRIIIRNNTIQRSGEDGIDITSGEFILLEGNTIEYSTAGGINVSRGRVGNVEIRRNFMNSNAITEGIADLTIRSPNVRAVNNIVVGTGVHAVLISNTTNTTFFHNVIAPVNRTGNFLRLPEGIGDVEIKNNIFDFSRTDQKINGEWPAGLVFDNNCYFGRSPSQAIWDEKTFETLKEENEAFEPNGLWADPEFVFQIKTKPQHLKLRPTSPCINRGASLSVQEDFWSTPRPQEDRADIGAYERVNELIYNPAHLGGFVWKDINGNSLYDEPNAQVSGASVLLFDAYGHPLDTSITIADGSYQFSPLEPGDYYLRFEGLPEGYIFVDIYADSIDSRNSNVIPGIGRTGIISLTSGDYRMEQNAGIFLPITISGQVWLDKNRDSILWGREPGISQVKLSLIRMDNLSQASLFTDGQGYFRFSDIPPGNYTLRVEESNFGAGGPLHQMVNTFDPDSTNNYRASLSAAPGDTIEKQNFGFAIQAAFKPGNIKARAERERSTVRLFPNPFFDTISLLPDGAEIMARSFQVVDQQGKVLIERDIPPHSAGLSIGLEHLPLGIYYLVIHTKDELESWPIIKKSR